MLWQDPISARDAVLSALLPGVPPPSLAFEEAAAASGHQLVAGVDEVGRGAWAGPLSVGIAVLDAGRLARGLAVPPGLTDSKRMTEKRREEMFEPVVAWCSAWAIGHAEPEECDAFGITSALGLAALRAVASLPAGSLPTAVLLDGQHDFVTPARADQLAPSVRLEPSESGSAGKSSPARGPAERAWRPPESAWCPLVVPVVRGDSTCASISAAALLAKVTRDRMMRAFSSRYPDMGFDKHKGYPTPAHRQAVAAHGMTPLHRRTWSC